MEIKKITIKAFRNIKDLVIDANHLNVISGNNMKGKTNTLNAISWCITGVDLNGSNNLLTFIPFGENQAEVEIEFDTFTLKRQANKASFNASQVIYIDGAETPVKQAENMVLEHFGLLSASLNDTKNFKLLRFLLNPLYYRDVAPKELRAYVVKALFGDLDETKIIDESSVNGKSITKSGIAAYRSFTNYINALAKEIKEQTAKKDSYETTLKVLNNDLDNNDFDETLIKSIGCYNLKILELKEKQVFANCFVEYLNKYLQNLTRDKNISITLYEKGIGEDVWKEVCYPQLFDTRLNGKLGSTAETIFVSVGFVETLKSYLQLPNLPMLIDEGETFDKKTFESLQELTNSQLFITKVEFEESDGIKVC